MSIYSAELIWKKARLGSSRTRHDVVENGFDTLQSEAAKFIPPILKLMQLKRTSAPSNGHAPISLAAAGLLYPLAYGHADD